jgi:hypothetical protein
MIANRWGIGIMQSLPIFIIELQTAKRELLKNFESPDESRPQQNATQRRRVVKNSQSLTLNTGSDIRFDLILHG